MSSDHTSTVLPRGQLRVRAASLEFQQLISNADILLATDVRNPENTWEVFHDLALQNDGWGDERTAQILTVPVDYETDDAEVLGALCMLLKGSCGLDRRFRKQP